CWTTPSAVIEIASTGQTCAQGATGSLQCMHSVGWVATLHSRSMKSTMIMLSPLCESHSRQAASQARHPIHRDGSMNIVLTMRCPFLLACPGRGEHRVRPYLFRRWCSPYTDFPPTALFALV